MQIPFAIFITVAINSSAGTTAFTKPIDNALSALMFLAPKIISLAIPTGTKRARRCVPPNPGVIPNPTSGCPNTAFSLATRISHAIASSHPPPNAKPLTAAITGQCIVSIERKILFP